MAGIAEGAFTAYKYCHRFMNDCPKRDVCLRCDRNMIMNWISCVMQSPNCNEGNGYPFLLLEPPEEDELPKNYFGSLGFGDGSEEPETEETKETKETKEQEVKTEDTSITQVVEYLNDLIKHSRATFYIEPFVGGSETIDKIKGIQNVLGTDLNPDAVEDIKKFMGGTSKTFRACDYKTWNKPLLSKEYQGKCIVFCDIPSDNETFNVEEFIETAKEWASKNKIVVRSAKLKRRRPVLELGDNDFLYRI